MAKKTGTTKTLSAQPARPSPLSVSEQRINMLALRACGTSGASRLHPIAEHWFRGPRECHHRSFLIVIYPFAATLSPPPITGMAFFSFLHNLLVN
jgi:hypothetical protein